MTIHLRPFVGFKLFSVLLLYTTPQQGNYRKKKNQDDAERFLFEPSSVCRALPLWYVTFCDTIVFFLVLFFLLPWLV